MGTNYYLRYNYCPNCGRYEEKHLGKSSGGWRFLFQINEEVHNFEEFKTFITKGEIYDSYEKPCTAEELLKLIDDKQKDVKNKITPDSINIDGYTFVDYDFV